MKSLLTHNDNQHVNDTTTSQDMRSGYSIVFLKKVFTKETRERKYYLLQPEFTSQVKIHNEVTEDGVLSYIETQTLRHTYTYIRYERLRDSIVPSWLIFSSREELIHITQLLYVLPEPYRDDWDRLISSHRFFRKRERIPLSPIETIRIALPTRPQVRLCISEHNPNAYLRENSIEIRIPSPHVRDPYNSAMHDPRVEPMDFTSPLSYHWQQRIFTYPLSYFPFYSNPNHHLFFCRHTTSF